MKILLYILFVNQRFEINCFEISLFVVKKASTNPVTVTIIYLASAFYNLCKNKLIEETTFILKKLLVLKYATP